MVYWFMKVLLGFEILWPSSSAPRNSLAAWPHLYMFSALGRQHFQDPSPGQQVPSGLRGAETARSLLE